MTKRADRADIIIPAAEGTDVLLDTTEEAFHASVEHALAATLTTCRETFDRLRAQP